MEMMRNRDPQMQEEGFHILLPHAGEHIAELIAEFGKEKRHGLQCWILELIGSGKSPEAFDFLTGHLRNEDRSLRYWAIWALKKLDTKDARKLLWEARSFKFASRDETNAFRSDLDAILSKQHW
jgi:hypothetical protein